MGQKSKDKGKPLYKHTDEEAKEIIIDQLIEGKSLLQILKKKELPSRKKVYTWLNPNHDNYDPIFRNNYAGAREDQADLNAENIEKIAEQVRKGKIDPSAGRVAIDALKWSAGRKKPSVYGDRIDVTSGNNPIESQVVIMIPDNGRDKRD